MKFLKNHPFAVEAFFDSSLVLTFGVPKEQLEKFIPACLVLDTFQGRWAFIAIAMVNTTGLRPKGFLQFLGNDFFLIGYRIFVRYTDKRGKRLRGLYIIKSETNKKRMEILGDIFTRYAYTTTDIVQTANDNHREIASAYSKFSVTIKETSEVIEMPNESPFVSWKDARRFSGPLPYTFACNEKNKTVLIVEGVRNDWQPKPVKFENYHFDFLNSLKLQGLVLANAFEIRNVPYYWKRGRMETWN